MFKMESVLNFQKLISQAFLLTFLLISFVSAAEEGSRREDSLALVAIQEANPQSDLEWNTDMPLNWWNGVSINSNERVDSLTFFLCRNLSTFPSEIKNLTQLTYLWVGKNKISELPPEIGNLTSLTHLFIGDNELVKLPAEIGKLSSLEELDIYGNKLTSVPSEIGKLSDLKNLYLYNNELVTLPSEIGNLSKLINLYLYDNKLTTLPSTIGQLTNLHGLYVHHNKIKVLPSSIGKLRSLNYLNFSDNKLVSLPKSIVKLTPKEVKIYFNIEQLVERTVYNIPIQIINVPKNITAEPTPATISVRVKGGETRISGLSIDDIDVLFDYSADYKNGRVNYLMQIKTPVDVAWVEASPQSFNIKLLRKEETP